MAAEFELGARNMGITEGVLTTRKVPIWEEVWAAKHDGEDIEASILHSLLYFRGGSGIY